MQINSNNKNLTNMPLNANNNTTQNVKKTIKDTKLVKAENCDTLELSTKEIGEIKGLIEEGLKDEPKKMDNGLGNLPRFGGFLSWLGGKIGGKIGEAIGKVADLATSIVVPFYGAASAVWNLLTKVLKLDQ